MTSALRTTALDPSEFSDFDALRAAAFGQTPRGRVKPGLTVELDRMLFGWLGTERVGAGAGASFELTLPSGSSVGCVGLRWLATLPTHRERGVMRTIVDELLAEARRRGEAVAAAWATAPAPYPRMGFGLSGQLAEYTAPIGIPVRDHLDHVGDVELLTDDEALEVIPQVYDLQRRSRAGLVSRTPDWWRHILSAGAVPVAARQQGEVVAYAIYRFRQTNDGTEVIVDELLGRDLGAESVLWLYLLRLEPATRLRAPHRTPDDALPLLVADTRHLTRRLGDAMWLRIVDIERVLLSLDWSTAPSLTIEIMDESLPSSAGTWTAGHKAHSMTSPDLTLHSSVLASCLLGGFRPQIFHSLGRLTEHRPGAVSELSSVLTPALPPLQLTWF